jgi:ADP-ribose pyrophosphatase YjhB (NUDIX family)
MPVIGVNIAIIEAEKIVLTQREDFEVWCLPGGEVDAGESLAAAAQREAREETGLEVQLTRLVGIYSRPQAYPGGSHIVLFAARPTGGQLRPQAGEVLQVGYFDRGAIEHLPLLLGQKQRILDALDGLGGGVAWTLRDGWPFPGVGRDQIYAQRDRSGLGRLEFYLHSLSQAGPERSELEVGAYEP